MVPNDPKFGISSSDEEISKISKNKFKSLVEKKVNEFAFKYLKDIAARHSKSLKILEESSRLKTLKKKNYLQENNFSKVDTQLLFELRTRILDVKTNFGEIYQNILTCRTCRKEDSIENEDHILQCDALKSEVENPGEVDFNFVYMDLNHQKKAVKAYKAVLRKREVLLKYQNDK